jgi:ferrous iron transport protein B
MRRTEKVGPLPRVLTVAVAGNPNSGKTTIFNALTGLRQKVGNYPGVTVERKEGRIKLSDGSSLALLDLPGLYSLAPSSPDEAIAADILRGKSEHTPAPDAVLCVVDATNLERNLFLVTEILDHNYPVVIALNMTDLAEERGIHIDVGGLSVILGVPVVSTIAHKAIGLESIRAQLKAPRALSHGRRWLLPEAVERECEVLAEALGRARGKTKSAHFLEAATLLGGNSDGASLQDMPDLALLVGRQREKLAFLGYVPDRMLLEARYQWINGVCSTTVHRSDTNREPFSDRLDRILTHKFWGVLVFLGLMAMMFQAMFSWASVPMEWISSGFQSLGTVVGAALPAGDLRDLLVDGALAGVSAVVTFVPQVFLMFLFIGILEDTGYMARAAFIMNRVMGRFGLHGKSFIPLLSSFACAIPGILATRTIDNRRDRLATMLVAPLMSCSARLPVYTLMIAAFIPATRILGVFTLPGLVLLSLYVLGAAAALSVAWLLKRTLLTGPPPVFIMELPAYALPTPRLLLIQVWERTRSFLQKAGTIILGASILLWFFATYPKLDHGTARERLEHSFAGQMGKVIEPAIAPLGFDWRIGIGLVGSLFQREIFVSTMGTLYNIDNNSSGVIPLQENLRNQTDPVTGKQTFTLLTAVCVMVYYVLAMQCLSTVAVMRRETGGWRWPLFQISYMTALAYVTTFLVYRLGLWLGGGA